jgi:hypothetical protein
MVIIGPLDAARIPATSGILLLYIWSWREESNPRPADYKSAALPTELRQPDPSFAADLPVVRNSHPDHLLEGGQL